MLKKFLIALALLTLPLTVSANWLVGAGYASLSAEDDGDNLSLGAIYGSLAYEFPQVDSNFSFIPELRIGTGVSDDKIGSVAIEIERFTELSIRGQYNYDNGVYLFIMPSYANLDSKASFRGRSIRENEWEFGFGGGFGKKINANTRVEVSFASYDDTDAFTVGFKYTF